MKNIKTKIYIIILVIFLGGYIFISFISGYYRKDNNKEGVKIAVENKVKKEIVDQKKEVKKEKEDEMKIKEYVVQKGDTISSIASKFSLNVDTILTENKLTVNSLIYPGMTLKILPVKGISYIIKKGDTLSNIALQYNIDQNDIKRIDYNQDDVLHVGEKVVLEGVKNTRIIVQKSISHKISKTPIYSGSTIKWSYSALHELYKVPYFVRPTVKKKVNDYARSHGIHYITRELFNNIHV